MHNTVYKSNLKRLGSLASLGHGDNLLIHGGDMQFNPVPFDVDVNERNSCLIEESRRSTMMIKD